jgi:hypothetical protein
MKKGSCDSLNSLFLFCFRRKLELITLT